MVNPLAKDRDQEVDFGTFVDRYGKDYPGFITFSEFQDIYMTHVFYADIANDNKHPPEQNMLRALFNALDADCRHKISRAQFHQFLSTSKPPASFYERLKQKVRRGGRRFVASLERDFQDADIPFGANGVLPMPAFQKIMADYDLPFTATDKPELVE